MQRKSLRRVAVLFAVSLMAGCAVGPDYKRPATGAPSTFRDENPEGDRSLADLSWWDLYQDAHLKDLIREALSNGFDAKIAAARVEESRAIAAQVHGQLFPELGYAASADRGKNAILGTRPVGPGAPAE
jgi:outer membrane protein, multidrug efflux system